MFHFVQYVKVTYNNKNYNCYSFEKKHNNDNNNNNSNNLIIVVVIVIMIDLKWIYEVDLIDI